MSQSFLSSLDVANPPLATIIRPAGVTMKNRAPLTLGLVVLTAFTFQQAIVCGEPAAKASQTHPETTQSPQSEWKAFSSRAGGFSVLMPGTPREETEVKEFPIVGKGEVHVFVVVNDSGFYLAGYLEIPGLAQQSEAFCDSFGKGFLRTVGDGTAKGAGGRVVKETDISIGNRPGKEILIEVPAGIATARAYFIRRRGYQLLAAPTSAADPGNVKKFLDSFKVIAQ